MKITTYTNFTPINGAGLFVPKNALFQFVNTGNTAMYINNHQLLPGDRFGVDNSFFIAIGVMFGKKVEVMEMTEYAVRFDNDVIDPIPLGPDLIQRGILARTEYRIEE